mgnify:CR=1 FL=1
MESLTALFTILYIFWPLIIFFGIKVLFKKGETLSARFRMSLVQIFVGWIIWAFFLVIIYWQGKKPIVFMPITLDHLLFGILGLISGSVTVIWIYRNLYDRRNRLLETQQLEDLLTLTPDQFEKLIKDLFEAYGYQADLSGGNADHGVDVIVSGDEDDKWVVQCKRYSGSVGEPIVRDLYGTMLHEEAQRAYLITTGTFTAQAKEWALGKPIVLYDGESLIKLIRRTQKRILKNTI